MINLSWSGVEVRARVRPYLSDRPVVVVGWCVFLDSVLQVNVHDPSDWSCGSRLRFRVYG